MGYETTGRRSLATGCTVVVSRCFQVDWGGTYLFPAQRFPRVTIEEDRWAVIPVSFDHVYFKNEVLLCDAPVFLSYIYCNAYNIYDIYVYGQIHIFKIFFYPLAPRRFTTTTQQPATEVCFGRSCRGVDEVLCMALISMISISLLGSRALGWNGRKNRFFLFWKSMKDEKVWVFKSHEWLMFLIFFQNEIK